MYIDAKDLPAALRPLHTGGLIRLEPTEQVTIPMDAGLWSGGTRRLFSLVDLNTGFSSPVQWHDTSPWHADRKECLIALQPNQCIAESGSFCGKNAGLHIYLHPSNAAALLPATETMSPECAALVDITCGLISSARREEWLRRGFKASQWTQAYAEALAKGLIRANGAITTKGRNARPQR